jgi:tetratricopeptide (TPR) repeat protein
MGFHRNAFHQTMLGLEFITTDGSADLFSQACVEQYRGHDSQSFGYLFAQVFEPNVLHETALLEGLTYEALAGLSHRPTPSMDHLAELVAQTGDLNTVELVNAAAALISVSRFQLADRLLEAAGARAASSREHFETAMLAFVSANRCEDDARSVAAFQRMRAAIETDLLPPDRILDACAQAVVWFLKRPSHISESDYTWYLGMGRALSGRPAALDPGSLSSWYRALAMVPAAEGKVEQTREYMQRARDAADDTLALRPRSYELHFLKTYHESTLKEHMYVTGDADRAEETGRALIAVDPGWAPSYGEVAESFVRFGRLKDAAEMYDQAVALGPPYVGHHLLRAARTHTKAGDPEAALEHYRTLSALVPDDVSVLTAGRDLARSTGHSSVVQFEALLERLAQTLDGTIGQSDPV